jgi:hypothetical protein
MLPVLEMITLEFIMLLHKARRDRHELKLLKYDKISLLITEDKNSECPAELMQCFPTADLTVSALQNSRHVFRLQT